MENARNSRREPGVARFDLMEQADDPARFMLYEVYRDAAAQRRTRRRRTTRLGREDGRHVRRGAHEAVVPRDRSGRRRMVEAAIGNDNALRVRNGGANCVWRRRRERSGSGGTAMGRRALLVTGESAERAAGLARTLERPD